MIDLLEVYLCPKCGKVLEDMCAEVEECDTDRDEVYHYRVHIACGREVRPPDLKVPTYESVDHERWLWATGFYDNLLDEEPEMSRGEGYGVQG